MEAIDKIEKKRLKWETISNRLVHADNKDFKAFIKQLEE